MIIYANRKQQFDCRRAELRHKDAHWRTFADEAMWGVAGDGTGPSVATWLSLTSIKHSVTVLTCGEITPKLHLVSRRWNLDLKKYIFGI